MNITQIIHSANATGTALGTQNAAQTGTSATTSASASTSATSPALRKAGTRLQTQLDATAAQLSSIGRLKASMSDAQGAARALGNLPPGASAADARAAAGQFATAFNQAVASARSVKTGTAPRSATAEQTHAARAGTDLQRALGTSGSTVDALRRIGFKQAADGTLTLDAAKLDAAQQADPAGVQAKLAQLGQRVDQAAGRELASGGNVGGSLQSLGQRSTALKNQQNSLLALQQALATSQAQSDADTTTSTQAGGSVGYVNYGVAAYRSNA